jgi:glutathionylspermidine synthase
MNRRPSQPRRNWESIVEASGLTWHTPGGHKYWDESACYEFKALEIDEIEAATEELERLCLEAGQYIIDHDRFSDLHIPEAAIPAIRSAWDSEPPSIYGRFDLAFDGIRPPKLLEYNAQTPTALLEASVIQWEWLRTERPRADQFNSIHDKLIAKWTDLKSSMKGSPLYFAHAQDTEDMMTVAYLRDTAQQAGIQTSALRMREIGWNRDRSELRDLDERPIRNLFTLYPWEWLLGESAEIALACQQTTIVMEPIWKMLWSNKGLLAILWEMFPNHPNLLEAHFREPNGMREYCRKPLLSREGRNILLRTKDGDFETGGDYGEEGFIYQALAPIPNLDGNWPVIGSWYITDQGPAGIGIRESSGRITDNISRFAPHYFD